MADPAATVHSPVAALAPRRHAEPALRMPCGMLCMRAAPSPATPASPHHAFPRHPPDQSPGAWIMLQSHPIDIDGVFVGAAVRLDRGYRFIATNMRLEELDQTIWPTLADVQRLARRLYLNGNFLEHGATPAHRAVA
jgi:hypothetical protein